MRKLAVLVLLVVGASPVHGGAADDAEAWHDALLDDIATDLVAGRPLVIEAHVPLCSNDVLSCGGHGLGDGDAPKTNLYWATSGGFVGWFGRKGSGWTQVAKAGADGEILEMRAWRRTVKPDAGWKRRGVKQPFQVVVVAHAWRGTSIDQTVQAYVADLYGGVARQVTLDDGTTVAAGGAAHVVAYVGHNRWMDYVDAYDFAAAAKTYAAKGARPKGTIALACKTADYLGDDVPAAGRVPLLMTTDFLFAGAHGFEGAVSAFAEGKSLASIRLGAAQSYATGQGKTVKKVARAFTNPADPRWRW